MRACMCLCAFVHVPRVCVRACVCVCVSVGVRACEHAHV